MKNQKINQLPFWETIGRSFKYVLKNKTLLITILPAVAALVVLQIFLGLPFLCSIEKTMCAQDWRQNFTFVSIVLTSIGIIINYCRTIVCKAQIDFVSVDFWKRMGLYIIASGALLFIISTPAFIAIFATVLLFNALNLSVISAVLALVIALAFCILFAPLFLVFPAIAVDDYKFIKWSKLFSITKGSYNAIFWGQFIITIPCALVLTMIVEIYQILGINAYFVNLIFVACGLLLGMIDACIKGAFFAHIYQFFKFYNKD